MKGEWLRETGGTTAVVFVHGILSSGETCWRNDNGTTWPTLLLGETDLRAAGIYVYTYSTGLFTGSYRLGDVVDDLKERLILDGLIKMKCLVFVCHSMGGVVVRKLLVERAADLIDGGTTCGLFLVASPSLGSSYANWLAPLAKLVGHAQAKALRFTQDNEWLNDLDKEFQNLKESGRLKLVGKELVEDKFVVTKRLWKTQVVEPFSGARYFGERLKVPGSDHFSIAKPEDANAIQHRTLCQFVQILAASVSVGGNGDPEARTKEARRSVAELIELCEYRAGVLIEKANNLADLKQRERFLAVFPEIHQKYITALADGNFVLAHELLTRIQDVLGESKTLFHDEHVQYFDGISEISE